MLLQAVGLSSDQLRLGYDFLFGDSAVDRPRLCSPRDQRKQHVSVRAAGPAVKARPTSRESRAADIAG
jgi:hypothetical protein